MRATTLAETAVGTFERLRCCVCRGDLQPIPGEDPRPAGALGCVDCGEVYPVVGGVPRLLPPALREALLGRREARGAEAQQVATARSFGYEWALFSEMLAEYERNFLEYQAPHGPGFFEGKRVLDAGCGSGRHVYYSAAYGAEVWGVDLGSAVEVARHNTRAFENVHIVQADLYNLPFEWESFDYVYSIGVLHHLPDPEGGFRRLLGFLKPGGEVRVYLYWRPERQPVKRLLLAALTAVRALTKRMPYRWVAALSTPAAALAFVAFVWPYMLARSVPGLRAFAERLPMKQYARYPFRVCVNDQFDRLSAPIENRYTRAEVEAWFHRAGLEAVTVRDNFGWVASGRKPAGPPE